MNIRRYLPSAQFALVICSFALSAGLVYAANFVTHPQQTPAQVYVAPQDASAGSDSGNWEAALYAIQAENASSSLTGPSQDSVNTLLAAAQSPNLTDTVARTLFINLSSAKSQGLGDDIPTQDQLVSAAMAQATQNTATNYTLADINVVPDSAAAEHAYGNAVMQIFTDHPEANQQATFVALGYATDNHDATELQKLPPIQAGYEAVTRALALAPVPRRLAPFHLEVVNDFAKVTASYSDMQQLLSDPLRGLVGLQNYQASLDEIGRVFTNIAESLNKDGILFTKDEQGSAWSAFLASP